MTIGIPIPSLTLTPCRGSLRLGAGGGRTARWRFHSHMLKRQKSDSKASDFSEIHTSPFSHGQQCALSSQVGKHMYNRRGTYYEHVGCHCILSCSNSITSRGTQRKTGRNLVFPFSLFYRASEVFSFLLLVELGGDLALCVWSTRYGARPSTPSQK